MLTAALVVRGLSRPDPAAGVLMALVTVPLFPMGLGYFFHDHGSGRGGSDAALAFMLIAPYFVYGALGVLLTFVRSRVGFVAACCVLAIVLSLTVKGCENADGIRWFSS